jgi:glucokinase
MDKGADRTAYVIAGDIGGTNSRIRLYAAEEKAPVLVGKDYLNEDFIKGHGGEAFYMILNDFLETCRAKAADGELDFDHPSITACFACAGPVKNNYCEFSNNHFIVNGQAIKDALNMNVRLIS